MSRLANGDLYERALPEVDPEDLCQCQLSECESRRREISDLPSSISHDEAEGEEALWFVIKKSQAEKIVRSVESGHSHEVVCILKQQPWWQELSARARGLSHGTLR